MAGWTVDDVMREEQVRQQRYERTLKEKSEDLDRRLERVGILPRRKRLPRHPTVDDMRRAGILRLRDW
jgi:hypothetical protein